MADPVTVRDAVIGLLRQFGSTTIFGNPGSTELPMFRDFPNDFRYVLGLQESVVVGMADGWAQASRQPAIVSLHSAAGVGHAMGNIFTAYRNRTPMVIVAGQQARELLPFEPYLFSQQATELAKPYVKWSVEPARAADVPAAVARAWYTARQPPAGPVLVSIPVDDWDAPAETVTPRRLSTTLRPDPALLAEAGAALDRAARPALVVGAGVDRDRAFGLAVTLAERHSAAVYVAPLAARCSFPETHPLFAGFLPANRAGIVAALAGHDLILVLGAPAFTYHIEAPGPVVPDGASLIQIVDEPDLAAWAPVGTAIVASLDLALSDLLDRPPPAARPLPVAPPRAQPVAAAEPIPVAFLMQALARTRPPGSIVVEEAPSSRTAMHDHLPITEADGFFTGASGGLGHGLPAAVGVALARPDRRVLALIGDGSAMYAIQALWSAVQLGVALTVVVIKNRRYAVLDAFARHFDMAPPVGLDLPGLDFVEIARGLGCPGVRVDRADALVPALAAGFAAPGPQLLEVMVG